VAEITGFASASLQPAGGRQGLMEAQRFPVNRPLVVSSPVSPPPSCQPRPPPDVRHVPPDEEGREIPGRVAE
jgi:hypothetical protein